MESLQEDMFYSIKKTAIEFLDRLTKSKAFNAAPMAGSEEMSEIYPTVEQRLRAALALARISRQSICGNEVTVEQADPLSEIDVESLRAVLLKKLTDGS
jgi:hypothetical protein